LSIWRRVAAGAYAGGWQRDMLTIHEKRHEELYDIWQGRARRHKSEEGGDRVIQESILYIYEEDTAMVSSARDARRAYRALSPPFKKR